MRRHAALQQLLERSRPLAELAAALDETARRGDGHATLTVTDWRN